MTEEDNKQTLLEFPCDFPIKIVGLSTEEFEKAIYTIINKHVADLTEGCIKTRLSKDGKYLAITVTITATSQEHLDAIYIDLSGCEHVIMAL